MNTSEHLKKQAREAATIIRRAKRILKEKGWTKDIIQNSKTGEVCEVGALRLALFNTIDFDSGDPKAEMYRYIKDTLMECIREGHPEKVRINISFFNDRIAKSERDIQDNFNCGIRRLEKIYKS